MKTRILAAGALAAALLATGVPLGATSASGATTIGRPLKIMLTGDSITSGYDGDYTWRYRLDQEFERQEIGHRVDLVGPSSMPKGDYDHYLGGHDWDTDHAATSGTSLHVQVSKVDDLVAAYDPDVLVSYLGTNDFLGVLRSNPEKSAAQLRSQFAARTERVLADWDRYVNAARIKKSRIKIVLGELITPRVPDHVRDVYNARLVEWAARKSTFASPVKVAEIDRQLWTSPAYLYDELHPTPTGESYLAQQFADRIAAITGNIFDPNGIFDTDPKIVRSSIAWNPEVTAKLRPLRGKVQLDWTYSKKYNRANQMRVRIETVRTEKTRRTSYTRANTWTSDTLAPGTYRLSVQAMRGKMTSGWSKTYVVKVK